MIAWGGVIAQLLVAIPLVVGLKVFGYSSFNSVNAVLVVLGPYSLMMAVFNLLPIGRLDGAVAWWIIPEAIKRVRGHKVRKAAAGRGPTY